MVEHIRLDNVHTKNQINWYDIFQHCDSDYIDHIRNGLEIQIRNFFDLKFKTMVLNKIYNDPISEDFISRAAGHMSYELAKALHLLDQEGLEALSHVDLYTLASTDVSDLDDLVSDQIILEEDYQIMGGYT